MTPLDLRELFARPWEGTGRVRLAWWLRWFPAPRTFGFRSEITDVDGDAWSVLDTTTHPSGRTERRRMDARRLGPDRVAVSAPDMPGGAVIHLRADGFAFTPYVIRTPVLGPLWLPLRFEDDVTVDRAGEALDDHLTVRVLGLVVAHVHIRLTRTAA